MPRNLKITPRCDQCRHWEREHNEEYNYPEELSRSPWGWCHRLSSIRGALKAYPGRGGFATGMSAEESGEMLTEPDFYCAKFEGDDHAS